MKISRNLMILNPDGVACRPAALFVKTRMKFPNTTVTVCCKDRKCSGKYILELLAMELAQGETITLTADGPEAEQVIIALQKIINIGFYQFDNCLPVPTEQALV